MLNAGAQQRGLTLVELMVAATLSMIALAAVLTTWTATARHASLQLRTAWLHQQLHGMLHLMGRDLRRAGYREFDPALLPIARNPFQHGENRLRSGALSGEAGQSCILLAYDLNRDGRVGVGQCPTVGCAVNTNAANVEQFGFRLRDQNLQARYGGRSLDCGSGYWQALNDPGIEITRLRFELRSHCTNLAADTRPCDDAGAQLLRQVVAIDLGARLRDSPETALVLRRWIRVRNATLRAAAP